jgi:flagellar assembly factor FliW
MRSSLEEGLLGFGDYHQYVILNADDGSPFRGCSAR